MPEDIIDSPPTKETATSERVPSLRAWETIVSNAAAGNVSFPQAFFAQGIRIADTMSSEAQREEVSLLQFLTSDPPKDLIDARFGHVRDVVHGMHDIRTNPSRRITTPLLDLWNKDKRHAEIFLSNVARMVRNDGPAQLSPMDRVTIYKYLARLDPQEVAMLQGNPLFQGLLGSASQALRLDTVTDLNKQYTEALSDFMHKYTEKDPDSYSLKPYKLDRGELRTQLTGYASAALIEIKDYMQQWIEAYHPREQDLRAKLATIESRDLFGDLDIMIPHPLRDPDE
jgi:hypothetical protein